MGDWLADHVPRWRHESSPRHMAASAAARRARVRAAALLSSFCFALACPGRCCNACSTLSGRSCTTIGVYLAAHVPWWRCKSSPDAWWPLQWSAEARYALQDGFLAREFDQR